MAPRQTDAAQVRILRLVELLCKHPVVGLANKDMADSLGYSRPNVCRDLDVLVAAGWAQKLDDGKYAISSKPLALFRFAEICFDDLTRRSNEFRGRVEAQSRQLLP